MVNADGGDRAVIRNVNENKEFAMNENRPKSMAAFSSLEESQSRAVCVYCGSGSGSNPAYAEAARTLGKALADRDLGLVYGGGSLGLMGETARATLKHGGRVTGIIPEFLSEREQMLEDVTDLHVVEDMHVRKLMMFKASHAFVALPGGIGTLEELVEQLTWSQLGQHTKPIVLANIEGFWDPFSQLLSHMRDQAFIRPGLEVSFDIVDTAEQILPAIEKAWKEHAPSSEKPIIANM